MTRVNEDTSQEDRNQTQDRTLLRHDIDFVNAGGLYTWADRDNLGLDFCPGSKNSGSWYPEESGRIEVSFPLPRPSWIFVEDSKSPPSIRTCAVSH